MAKDCQKGKPVETGGNASGQDAKPLEGTTASGARRERPEVRCYNCGQKGHISRRCPSSALFCSAETQQSRVGGARAGGVTRGGVVEGWRVADILLDTGCSKTLVRRELVREEKFLEGDVVTIRCAHGDTVLYPRQSRWMDALCAWRQQCRTLCLFQSCWEQMSRS